MKKDNVEFPQILKSLIKEQLGKANNNLFYPTNSKQLNECVKKVINNKLEIEIVERNNNDS